MGTPSYSQGYAPPPFNWSDRARVYKMGEKVKNPSGKYEDVLVIEEWNDVEPEAKQLKYYARGIGNIGIGWMGDDPNQETMDLIWNRTLNGKDLTRVRKQALELETRAYVYATTPPAEIRTQEKKSSKKLNR